MQPDEIAELLERQKWKFIKRRWFLAASPSWLDHIIAEGFIDEFAWNGFTYRLSIDGLWRESQMAYKIDPASRSDMSSDRVELSLREAEWQFARTMPQNPHWYTLRKKWVGRNFLSDDDFVDVVFFIRANGEIERFPPVKGKKYTVLKRWGFKYWTMGCPVWSDINYNVDDNTILINRKPLTREEIAAAVPKAEEFGGVLF